MWAEVAYKKGKDIKTTTKWIVSKYDKPSEIMSKSKHTMRRLRSEIYGKSYKGEKHIMIRSITSKKVVGNTFK
jgi:hypothetical protein